MGNGVTLTGQDDKFGPPWYVETRKLGAGVRMVGHGAVKLNHFFVMAAGTEPAPPVPDINQGGRESS